MRRARLFVGLLIVLVTALLMGGAAVRYFRPTIEPPAWANDYDTTAVPPEMIPAGTEIGTKAPKGWSHLVIKSLPRVKPSEVPKLPDPPIYRREGLRKAVSWMFTAFAADVVQERQGTHTRYRLRAIGLGLGANVKGTDMVLTVDSADGLGQPLTPDQKETLRIGYEIQRQARVVVQGPSFALLDTPVSFRCGDKNRMVRYRYALLVDAATGRLDVWCWRLGAENGVCADLGRAVLLKPDPIDECELIVDTKEFKWPGIPNEKTFGVDELPPFRLEVPLPAALSELAGKTRYAPDDARTLEDGLRALLPKS
jgi:hypothetical protein